MSSEMLDFSFGVLLVGIFILSIVVLTGILYIAYTFSPQFRKFCDDMDENLPEWEEVE